MRRIVHLCLYLLCAFPAAAQTDSLWRVWNDATQADSARLKAMQVLAWKTVFEQPDSGMKLAGEQLALALRAGDGRARYEAYTTLAVGSSMRSAYGPALDYLRQGVAVARELGDRKREANALRNMSNVYKNTGDLPQALAVCQQALAINQELENKSGIADTYNTIGNLYTELRDPAKALKNYERSQVLYAELNDAKGRAQALQNIGVTHLEMGERARAVEELLRSLDLYRGMERRMEMGMVFNNLGRAYSLMQRNQEAHAHLDSARVIFTSLGSKRQLARTHYYTGELLRQEGRFREAVRTCTEGLEQARAAGLLQQQKECSECLMLAHEASGDLAQAYQVQKLFMQLGDSLGRMNNDREVTRLELQHAFQQQQIEDSLRNVQERYEQELAHQTQMGRERDQRNLILFTGIGVLLVAGGLWNRLRFVRRSRAALQKEKDRSENLLLNILPAAVAEELKAKGEAEAVHFDSVTVLFTDFKGFTALSERMTPGDLVRDLNACFSTFDRICEKHGIEKIKTIGDAYMAAGGLPVPNTTHAIDVIHAALEMRDFIAGERERKTAAGLPCFEIRIGIHTGPVVAGIVGVKKFQYDIWGDTVNTAARMESSGEVGRVNISEATYELVKEQAGTSTLGRSDLRSTPPELLGATRLFDFIPRGGVEAKGKGSMEMWFVEAHPGGPRDLA